MGLHQTVEKRRESMRGLGATRIPIVAGGVYGATGAGFSLLTCQVKCNS